jgi:hypothetical protein
MKSLLFIIALIGYINCYAGTIDPKINDQYYLDYGSKFKCVVSVCGTENSGQKYCASAVAIKPRWILTAAHVVKNAKTCQIKIDSKQINVSTIISHKDFNDDSFGYYDIALGFVDEDMNLDFYPELYQESDEVGKVCGISGYGITGTFVTGAKISDGNKRAGSNIVNYIDKHLLICNLEDKNTSMEFLIASGDSGGGLFIDKKLAGINSCVMTVGKNPNSSYNSESGHTRISKHLKWIQERILENEKK